MRIMLATLCLNEMEWLPRLFEQHRNWPGLVSWVFVEAADEVYAKENPDSVFPGGLSTDGTTEYLLTLHRDHDLVRYVPHGYTSHPTDPAQGKCQARNRYLEVADRVRPDFVIVVDADEFYTVESQRRLTDYLQIQLREETFSHGFSGFRIKQRHIWKPPSQQPGGLPLFDQEVVGGYWDIPHTRVWRWSPGIRYRDNHNWPSDSLGRMDGRTVKLDLSPCGIECIHLGYASAGGGRVAKHRYYTARGEGSEGGKIGHRRRMYVECRQAWESWEIGDKLPHGARAIPYSGSVPEVFQ